MKAAVIVVVVAAAMFGLMGCATESPPMAGVVGPNSDFPVGQYAPDIPFTSVDGKETTFDEIRQPIAVLAFTDVSSQTGCTPSPALIDLASRFEDLPITVAQVHLPTGEHQTAAEHYNLHGAGIVTLCDAQHVAWRSFGSPKSNTVLLVDDNGKIVGINKRVDSLENLAAKAQRLGEAVEDAAAEHYER